MAWWDIFRPARARKPSGTLEPTLTTDCTPGVSRQGIPVQPTATRNVWDPVACEYVTGDEARRRQAARERREEGTDLRAPEPGFTFDEGDEAGPLDRDDVLLGETPPLEFAQDSDAQRQWAAILRDVRLRPGMQLDELPAAVQALFRGGTAGMPARVVGEYKEPWFELPKGSDLAVLGALLASVAVVVYLLMR